MTELVVVVRVFVEQQQRSWQPVVATEQASEHAKLTLLFFVSPTTQRSCKAPSRNLEREFV